ncbi:hypothetical protein GTY54_19320 [Streptomyces sp. SID625]|nr:hypothetical protein [Streptomyces sp. SID625]
MSDDEPRRTVTPTRVIPAGAPLPERAPEPGEVPPWRLPPPPPPPPAVPDLPPPPPDPGTPAPAVVVQHVHEVVLRWPEPEPHPSRWERLTAWLRQYVRPWDAVIGLACGLVPIPGTGYSAATTWHYTVGTAREIWGVGWGYGFGLVPLLLTANTVVRHGGSPARLFFLTVTFVGSLAAISWWDPFEALTGVPR